MSSLDDIDDYDPNYKPETSDKNNINDTTDNNDNNILDEFLNELSETERTIHINRILQSLRINPYDILDVSLNNIDSDKVIQQQYKTLSLIVHPDKNPNNTDNAQSAFTLIGKAKNDLNDSDKRKHYIDLYEQSKQYMKDKHSKLDTKSTEYYDILHTQFNESLIDYEWLQRQSSKQQRDSIVKQHVEKEQKRNEINVKEQQSKQWNAKQDDRINDWRKFQKGNMIKKQKLM